MGTTWAQHAHNMRTASLPRKRALAAAALPRGRIVGLTRPRFAAVALRPIADRIYFQEYVPSPPSHIGTIGRNCWGIAAAGGDAEYDVPQCAPGTPVEDCKVGSRLTLPSRRKFFLHRENLICEIPGRRSCTNAEGKGVD